MATNPRSVAAYQYIALAYVNLVIHGWSVDFAADAAARLAAARQATTLSPGDALSHGLLASALCFVGDAKNAAEAARRALELDRNSVQALGPISGTMAFSGDPHEALGAVERVLDLAPAHYGRAQFVSIAALLHWKLGNPARAVALADEGADLKRESALGPLVQAVTMVGAGRLEDGTAALVQARSLRPDLGPSLVRSMLPFANPADCGALLDALRQAGLSDA